MITTRKYYKFIGNDFQSECVRCAAIVGDAAYVIRSNDEHWWVATKDLQEIKKPNNMLLPTDPQERKNIPITTGFLDYFPLAVAEVAKCSKAGNDQHHPGEELFWDKTKSIDHADCIARHLVDRGKFDTDGQRHSAKLAWRSLALLQLELENEKEKP